MLVIGYFYLACSNCKSKHLSPFQLNENHTLDDDEGNLSLAYYDFHVMKWCPIIVSGKTTMNDDKRRENGSYEQLCLELCLDDFVCICKLGNSILVLLFQLPHDDHPTIIRYTFNVQDTSKGILKQVDYKNDQDLDINKCVEQYTLTCSVKEDRFIFEKGEGCMESLVAL